MASISSAGVTITSLIIDTSHPRSNGTSFPSLETAGPPRQICTGAKDMGVCRGGLVGVGLGSKRNVSEIRMTWKTGFENLNPR